VGREADPTPRRHADRERAVRGGWRSSRVLAHRQMRWRETGELADETPQAALLTFQVGRLSRWQLFPDRKHSWPPDSSPATQLPQPAATPDLAAASFCEGLASEAGGHRGRTSLNTRAGSRRRQAEPASSSAAVPSACPKHRFAAVIQGQQRPVRPAVELRWQRMTTRPDMLPKLAVPLTQAISSWRIRSGAAALRPRWR
jgi:hypothetical protein